MPSVLWVRFVPSTDDTFFFLDERAKKEEKEERKKKKRKKERNEINVSIRRINASLAKSYMPAIT